MPGILSPSVTEVAAVAGWPGARSLFRTGWTSFASDRVTVYHRLDDSGQGPSIEVTTYVGDDGVARSTESFLLERLSALKSPPKQERVVLEIDGSPVECSVLRSRNAWVAVSEGDPVITVFAREFPLGAVRLERVALTGVAGHDRLTASAS